MPDLEFVPDHESWRMRRQRELAEMERRRQRAADRAYFEDRFGPATLRLIRWVMIPVWIALAVFLLALANCAIQFGGWTVGLWE